jgi:hypothetical protein
MLRLPFRRSRLALRVQFLQSRGRIDIGLEVVTGIAVGVAAMIALVIEGETMIGIGVVAGAAVATAVVVIGTEIEIATGTAIGTGIGTGIGIEIVCVYLNFRKWTILLCVTRSTRVM